MRVGTPNRLHQTCAGHLQLGGPNLQLSAPGEFFRPNSNPIQNAKIFLILIATGRRTEGYQIRSVLAAGGQGEGPVPAFAIGGDAGEPRRVIAAADAGYGRYCAGQLR